MVPLLGNEAVVKGDMGDVEQVGININHKLRANGLIAVSSNPLVVKDLDPSTTNPNPLPTGEPSTASVPPKKPTTPGLGFGSSSSTLNKPSASTVSSKKKQSSGNRRERATIIQRRAPVKNPGFGSEQEEDQSKEQSKNESGFMLT
ncbi:hypothetical protein L1049_019957 [Liquidambar formosana]|uniref:Uncharacterized protein n=1 Tax=Liquidambar formosana TaxID=63359 RepID=A0AAP0SAL4_LIQFO